MNAGRFFLKVLSGRDLSQKPKPEKNKTAWEILGSTEKKDDLEKRDLLLSAEIEQMQNRIRELFEERCTIAGTLRRPMPRMNNNNGNNKNNSNNKQVQN